EEEEEEEEEEERQRIRSLRTTNAAPKTHSKNSHHSKLITNLKFLSDSRWFFSTNLCAGISHKIIQTFKTHANIFGHFLLRKLNSMMLNMFKNTICVRYIYLTGCCSEKNLQTNASNKEKEFKYQIKLFIDSHNTRSTNLQAFQNHSIFIYNFLSITNILFLELFKKKAKNNDNCQLHEIVNSYSLFEEV
ncbi:hypothetical protein RFI_28018, partial [Reticulomyxa filosa]